MSKDKMKVEEFEKRYASLVSYKIMIDKKTIDDDSENYHMEFFLGNKETAINTFQFLEKALANEILLNSDLKVREGFIALQECQVRGGKSENILFTSVTNKKEKANNER